MCHGGPLVFLMLLLPLLRRRQQLGRQSCCMRLRQCGCQLLPRGLCLLEKPLPQALLQRLQRLNGAGQLCLQGCQLLLTPNDLCCMPCQRRLLPTQLHRPLIQFQFPVLNLRQPEGRVTRLRAATERRNGGGAARNKLPTSWKHPAGVCPRAAPHLPSGAGTRLATSKRNHRHADLRAWEH